MSGRTSLDSARKQWELCITPERLFAIRLSRLYAEDLAEMQPFCIPLAPNYRCSKRSDLLLPRVLLGAELCFGPSSDAFDRFKCSFRFPLALSAMRDGIQLQYVLLLGDFRGSFEISFHRLSKHPSGTDGRVYHQPFPDELGHRDLDYLTDYLEGYLYGIGESVEASAEPFHRIVRSENLAYGKRDCGVFERRFDDWERFASLVEQLGREQSPEGPISHASVAGQAAPELTRDRILLAESQARRRLEEETRLEATVLLTILGIKFGALPEIVESRVEQASTDELFAWTRRIDAAETLEAVFASEAATRRDPAREAP